MKKREVHISMSSAYHGFKDSQIAKAPDTFTQPSMTLFRDLGLSLQDHLMTRDMSLAMLVLWAQGLGPGELLHPHCGLLPMSLAFNFKCFLKSN